jgi:DNA damage-binding protein 1
VYDTHLVLSFVSETRILAMNEDDELDEADIDGFDTNSQVMSGGYD